MLGFGAAVSTASGFRQALDETVPAALSQAGGEADLALCFFSMEHAEAAGDLVRVLAERSGGATVLGCTAQGVIGTGQELEDTPALALWVARLPGVRLRPFHLRLVELPEGYGIVGWPGFEATERVKVLLLADPFSFPADRFLERLNEEQPGLPVIGGMASGATEPGGHRMLLGTDAVRQGAVGVALSGPVEVRTVVSQGCRPVGAPYAVTRADGNLVQELGGRPAVQRLRELLSGASPHEQSLIAGGIQIGRVIDEHKADFGRGDFLIRNLLGADPQSGAVAVGDAVELGQTMQFHVRDAAAAGEELAALLDPVPSWRPGPGGVLLFSCNGRGRRFFGVPNHDAAKVAEATAAVPMAGFFAQGELGPVGGRNFLHSYTASMALFCEPGDAGSQGEALPSPGPGPSDS